MGGAPGIGQIQQVAHQVEQFLDSTLAALDELCLLLRELPRVRQGVEYAAHHGQRRAQLMVGGAGKPGALFAERLRLAVRVGALDGYGGEIGQIAEEADVCVGELPLAPSTPGSPRSAGP